MIAINYSIPTTLVSSPADLEVLTIKIGAVQVITLCLMYIPPNSSYDYHRSIHNYLSKSLTNW